MKHPTLTTDRLTLRPLGVSDRAEFVRVWTDGREHFRPWFPAEHLSMRPDRLFDDWLNRLAATKRDRNGLRYAAFENGGLVGFFHIANIVMGPLRSGYASWNVAADAIGRGIAVEATTALLRHGFASGLHRIQANVIPSNKPSMRLAERLGFRREGLAKKYLQIAGHWQDHVMFAMLAEEFSP
ncbi:MAG: GNAT family protein [Planctomycetota bacterium]